MKKKTKLIISLICFLMTLFFIVNHVYGADYTYDFTSLDGKGNSTELTTKTEYVVGTIISVIRIVGTGIAIIMLTYVAIKYMSAAPSEKAEFKKSATAYIVGAIVLMATSNIIKIIADFATTNLVTPK